MVTLIKDNEVKKDVSFEELECRFMANYISEFEDFKSLYSRMGWRELTFPEVRLNEFYRVVSCSACKVRSRVNLTPDSTKRAFFCPHSLCRGFEDMLDLGGVINGKT